MSLHFDEDRGIPQITSLTALVGSDPQHNAKVVYLKDGVSYFGTYNGTAWVWDKPVPKALATGGVLTLDGSNVVIALSNATAATATIAALTAAAVGSEVELYNVGAGAWTFTTAGELVNGIAGKTTFAIAAGQSARVRVGVKADGTTFFVGLLLTAVIS